DDIKNQGILLPEAEALLQQAKNMFDEKKYSDAKLLAEEAENEALVIKEKANVASSEIDKAISAINTAKETGKTLGLEIAEDLLEESQQAYANGDYLRAFTSANQAFEAGIAAEYEEEDDYFLQYFGFAGLILIILIAFYLNRKFRSRSVSEFAKVDLDYLFDVHDDLREDDRDVIEFLAENGGEAFAMEIRNKFQIPRTSTWRLIKRLNRLEIIDERKIGGQTLVRIKDVYWEGVK
ncbi:MAG: helix-turn-helix transcriptional regulator, partial [Candidatus Hodarchaeales archaeon]